MAQISKSFDFDWELYKKGILSEWNTRDYLLSYGGNERRWNAFEILTFAFVIF